VHAARDFLAAGRGRFSLVIGAEKMTATPGEQVGDTLLAASYQREEGDIPAASREGARRIWRVQARRAPSRDAQSPRLLTPCAFPAAG
jgi:hypothetical protein